MTKPSNIVKAYIDPYTGIVYADEGKTSLLDPIGFVISSGTRVNGGLLHSSLAGLTSDDHTQYALVDASRAFTDLPFTTFTGTPTQPGDLITKAFLDTVVVSGVAGVASLNSLTGTINLVGSGIVSVSTTGNAIIIDTVATAGGGSGNALIGADGITVTSGSSTTTLTGFRSEFVSASGSLQSQITSNTNAIANLDAIYATDAQLTSVSGHLQSQITAISGGGSGNSSFPAITGSDGITITSGTNTANVAGFRAEFVAASGSLQSQISTISGGGGQASVPAIVGADGITVTSGSNTTTVAGFRTEFVSASGSLQSQIDNLDATYATDAQLTSVSGHLQNQISTISGGGAASIPAITGSDGITVISGSSTINIAGFRAEFVSASGSLQNQITTANADVSSLNGLQDAITLAGSDFINISSAGQNITVAADALIGTNGITVSSGTSAVTFTGFYTEFTTASGHLQAQLGAQAAGANAIVGAGSVTVTSGTSTTTVSGAEVIDKNFIANTTIGLYDFVHITSSGNRVAPSIASNSNSIEVLGMALNSASAGTNVNVRLHGVVEGANNTLGFSVGSPVFLSPSVYGDGSLSAPSSQGQFILQLGHALNSADFYVNVNSATAVEITAEITPVLTLNSVSGTITVTGTGATNVSTVGQAITINTPVDKALAGDSFISVSSGTSTINITADAIVAGAGISVVSGTSTVTISATGDSGAVANAIIGDSFISVVSGSNTTQLSADSILGTDGNTIISGSNSVTVQGFRTEFVSASGSLQSQITTFSDHGNLSGLGDDDHTQYILHTGSRAFTGSIQANASGTLDIGSSNTPFDEMFGTPVVREFVAVSGTPRRGMVAIDSNNQFVGYNGTDWVIMG